MVSSGKMCLVCKGGKNLCGWRRCPLLARMNVKPDVEKIGQDFFGPSSSVFVGRFGVPNVYMGPMASLESLPDLDNPDKWFGKDYSEIIRLRSVLLRSKQKENVYSKSRFVSDVQELALASKPTDVEMGFKKRPVYRVSFSDVNPPMGPSAALKNLRVTENPRISGPVEKIVGDELKAVESSFLLYKSGLDVHRISVIFSTGALGLEENRKLVPTRFSITALDDLIAKELMKKIRAFPSINEWLVFESQYLDNHFVILLMPGSWEFENFEAWAPGSTWAQGAKETQILEEYEPYKGRIKYADKQQGGYYASRIAAAEKLREMRRQAKIISFREISEGYVIPMGVFVVRETARNAFRNQPQKFATREEALKHIGSKLKIPIGEYKKQSKILGRKTIGDFV